MLRSLKFAVVSFAAFALHPAAAIAQDWPTKPVKILIGFGAGGGTDVATRIVAEGLSEILGQQFTVENRPGAGGTIAGGMAARAPKDGYTAVALSMGHTVSAVMVKNVPYDPVDRLRTDRYLHQLGDRGRGRQEFAGNRPQESGRNGPQRTGKI